MTILQAILLGILQGITEFAPVSSSGHLVLIPWLLGWDATDLTFGVVVHFGTMFGVVAYLWRDWLRIIKGVLQPKRDEQAGKDARLFLMLIIGTIPAALAGLLFESFFERIFEKPLYAALMLLVTAGLLALGEKLGNLTRGIHDVKWLDSLLIGIAQAVAIIPGVSRSGATIAAAQMRHFRREEAAHFSFLLGTVIIAGAGGVQLLELFQEGIELSQVEVLIAGFLSALISGYLVVRWMLAFLKERPTYIFSIYCVCLSIFSLIVFVIRG